MKLTKAEKELVLRERHRLALDSRDWNREPYITYVQLREMSSWCSELLLRSPVWQRDYLACVLRNTAHPDNHDWDVRRMLLEALKDQVPIVR